jgi:hypothetical protein
MMIAPAGQPATYDIQLKGDANGSIGLEQLYDAFAPQGSELFTIFGDILANIDVPGMYFEFQFKMNTSFHFAFGRHQRPISHNHGCGTA